MKKMNFSTDKEGRDVIFEDKHRFQFENKHLNNKEMP